MIIFEIYGIFKSTYNKLSKPLKWIVILLFY